MDNPHHKALETSVGVGVILAGVGGLFTMASGETPGKIWWLAAWAMVAIGLVITGHGLWPRHIRRTTRGDAKDAMRNQMIDEIVAFRETMRKSSSLSPSVGQLARLAALKLEIGQALADRKDKNRRDEIGGPFFGPTEEAVRQECNRLIRLLENR